MDHITAIATITRTVGARVVLITGALLLLTACPPKEPTSCPDVDVLPPFEITVRAEDGPLPPDTLIRLAYGSGEEEFALAAPSEGPVMFCKPTGTSTAGAGGETAAAGAGGETATTPTEVLRCEIWEEGAVTLRVSGGDYPELVEELQGEADECGPETVEEELVLGATATDSSDE